MKGKSIGISIHMPMYIMKHICMYIYVEENEEKYEGGCAAWSSLLKLSHALFPCLFPLIPPPFPRNVSRMGATWHPKSLDSLKLIPISQSGVVVKGNFQ